MNWAISWGNPILIETHLDICHDHDAIPWVACISYNYVYEYFQAEFQKSSFF